MCWLVFVSLQYCSEFIFFLRSSILRFFYQNRIRQNDISMWATHGLTSVNFVHTSTCICIYAFKYALVHTNSFSRHSFGGRKISVCLTASIYVQRGERNSHNVLSRSSHRKLMHADEEHIWNYLLREYLFFRNACTHFQCIVFSSIELKMNCLCLLAVQRFGFQVVWL